MSLVSDQQMKKWLSLVRNSKAFTLIEVLAAIGISGLLMFSVMQIISLSATHFTRNKDALGLATLGESFAEELLISTGVDGALDAGSHVRYYDREGRVQQRPDAFKIEWTVTPDVPTTGIIEIVISASGRGDDYQRKITFKTYRQKASTAQKVHLDSSKAVAILPIVYPPPTATPTTLSTGLPTSINQPNSTTPSSGAGPTPVPSPIKTPSTGSTGTPTPTPSPSKTPTPTPAPAYWDDGGK